MDQLELKKRILRHVSRMKEDERPLESMELADKWSIDRDEMAEVCNELVVQGLVEKENYRSSKNNVVLHQLTVQGQKFVQNEWWRK